jgi:hypothetical protein
MSRIELGGFGLPIPLPEDGLENVEDEEHLLPLSYNLPDGTIFRPADYIAFGYNHYQVIAIGASGGTGGNVPELGGSKLLGAGGYGGGGGGGGLHIVSGRLDELPEEVPVEVGKPGADGTDGNGMPYYTSVGDTRHSVDYPNEYLAVFWYNVLPTNRLPYAEGGAPKPPFVRLGDEGSYVLIPQFTRLPQHTYTRDNGQVIDSYTGPVISPTDGQDGEASKFGNVAMASGGKAGKKAPHYRETAWGSTGRMLSPGGDGGEGGIGGSEIAGGGAAGGTSPTAIGKDGKPFYRNIEAKDGSWDGTIGQGGGGGRGAGLRWQPQYNNVPGLQLYTSYYAVEEFSNGDGGKGSFNNLDTSRYGPGGDSGYRGGIGAGGGGATILRRTPGSIFGGAYREGPFSSIYGKIPGNVPDGVVIIRLTRED